MIGRLRRCLLIPAVGLVLVGAPALAVDRPSLPRPTSTSIPLSAPLLNGAESGWTGEADVAANLVGVKWAGDPATEFRIEIQNGGSDWKSVGDIGPIDVAPDAGTPDANSAEHNLDARDANATEPVWVGRDVTAVRVTIVSGSVVRRLARSGHLRRTSRHQADRRAHWGCRFPTAPTGLASAIALVLAGLILGAVAVGWSPWRSRRSAALALAVAMVVLVGCEPDPPPPPVSPTAATPAQPAMTTHSDWGPDLGWNP